MSEVKLSRCGKNTTKRPTENRDVCPFCKNTGRETIDDGGQGTLIECRCGIWQTKKMSNRLKFAALPETFQNTRLSNFDVSVYKSKENQKKADIAFKSIKYWIDNFASMKERGMGLYLHSVTKGSGKTRMVASIANELIDKQIQVKFSTSLQILNEIKASWDRQESECSENKLLEFLSTADILIIDDFGTEKSDKSWINERFYHIINSRYVDKKIIIFTSNTQLDFLKYDDRITNRIKERTFQIPFPEESIREVIAKQNMMELIGAMRREEVT